MSGLEQEFPGKVKAANVDASTEPAKKAIQELGFKTHGLVIRDAHGKAVFKQPDHTVNLDEARSALENLIKTK
ncbi:MAG TPA: hypothetical protein VFW45_08685 [Candidatus Polarisedimenticolia bacterium]|nr:hypothetical protein [Candidatus Polarisedimenticolia bacterium]